MDFLVRSEDLPGGYGQYPGSRSVEDLLKNGVIILDKWPGPTSRDVTATVKKILNLNKTGHAGTLDPAVSGVLPICLENACKVMPALQKQDKEYVGVMRLHKDVGEADLRKAVDKFVGKIRQRPPVRSAVARRMRERNVYSFQILDKIGRDVLFRIACEAGTYVRVICHQIGQQIGGANMAELRRTKAGAFGEDKCTRIQDVVDAYHEWKENGDKKIRDYILPVEAGVEHLLKIIIKDSAVYSIAAGSPLYSNGISKISKEIITNDMIAILTLKGELVALAKANMDAEDMLRKKGIAAKTDRVIIDRMIYPKT
ncbi:MAG: RNA-guided pseudouridylation complex pseudouridine synthase subunit Cbf5 [Candidatus Aenigmarchaeota archaeon]|nr:RNA-guided pseudouridylation complex pseudouridine synthase subunit Cbf5 [Candidatus Aenigmarchaeota archaeon]